MSEQSESRQRFENFTRRHTDVIAPAGRGVRDLESAPGWTAILEEFCDQLREWHADGWSVRLQLAKEKSGALRLFTDVDYSFLTTLQTHRLSRSGERARRKSLKTCRACGRPGRLRWRSLAGAMTLCDEHLHLAAGEARREDGIILDPDRQSMRSDGRVGVWPEKYGGPFSMTDAELGLDEGVSMDLAKQMEVEFKPFLTPDLKLDGTDLELADLRRKLLAVDQAIGRHHEVKFQKRRRGYEIAIDNSEPTATIDLIKRDAIIAEIEMIMGGAQT